MGITETGQTLNPDASDQERLLRAAKLWTRDLERDAIQRAQTEPDGFDAQVETAYEMMRSGHSDHRIARVLLERFPSTCRSPRRAIQAADRLIQAEHEASIQERRHRLWAVRAEAIQRALVAGQYAAVRGLLADAGAVLQETDPSGALTAADLVLTIEVEGEEGDPMALPPSESQAVSADEAEPVSSETQGQDRDSQ